GVDRPNVIRIDPERMGGRVQRHVVHGLDDGAAAGAHLFRGQPDDVDDVLRREMLDHLDHHETAEARLVELAQVFDRTTDIGLQASGPGPLDEARFGLYAACVDVEAAQQLEELAAAEADVEDRIAADEAIGEVAVTAGDVVSIASEVRVEGVGLVPRVDSGTRDACRDVGHANHQLLQSIILLRELELQVVELLNDARVVRVG